MMVEEEGSKACVRTKTTMTAVFIDLENDPPQVKENNMTVHIVRGRKKNKR
jgi:hypothetical protein